MGLGRKQMALDIITIFRNSTETKLASMKDNSIAFGLRTFGQMFAVQYREGVFVGVARGPVDPLTMSGAKQELEQSFQLQLYKVGHDPEADQKWLVDMSEEIETELWKDTNMQLANGGDFLGVTEYVPGPPLGRGELTLHFILMEVLYRKTGTM